MDAKGVSEMDVNSAVPASGVLRKRLNADGTSPVFFALTECRNPPDVRVREDELFPSLRRCRRACAFFGVGELGSMPGSKAPEKSGLLPR